MALLCGWLSGCRQEVSQLEALNKQATSEYEQPIRPGGVDGQPFWNINAKKFIYAPVLGFGSVEGAEAYRCEVLVGDSVAYKWESADTCVSLAGRWASLPVGKVDVAFTALDGGVKPSASPNGGRCGATTRSARPTPMLHVPIARQPSRGHCLCTTLVPYAIGSLTPSPT